MQPSSQLILEHFHHPQRNPLAVATPSPHPHAPGNYIFTLCLYGFAFTADGDCSHKIKRHLLLERKAMTNLDSVLKSRDVTLPNIRTGEAIVFQ